MSNREGDRLSAELRAQLLALLAGGQAHADFEKVVDGMPNEMRGEIAQGVA